MNQPSLKSHSIKEVNRKRLKEIVSCPWESRKGRLLHEETEEHVREV